MTVYVLTDAEAGWDCVRGVFQTERGAMLSVLEGDYRDKTDSDIKDEFCKAFPYFIIHKQQLLNEK